MTEFTHIRGSVYQCNDCKQMVAVDLTLHLCNPKTLEKLRERDA